MELLIVIGVLGILAAGLLAAIDPFEQLKKARDTNNRNATVELLSGLTRYYANHGAFPWNLTTPPTVCNRSVATENLGGFGAMAADAFSIQDTALSDCIEASLVTDGELKTTYMDGIGSLHIFVASDPTDATNLITCFKPEGKSARSDAATKYEITGTSKNYAIVDQTTQTPQACPDVTNGDCAQCFK